MICVWVMHAYVFSISIGYAHTKAEFNNGLCTWALVRYGDLNDECARDKDVHG